MVGHQIKKKYKGKKYERILWSVLAANIIFLQFNKKPLRPYTFFCFFALLSWKLLPPGESPVNYLHQILQLNFLVSFRLFNLKVVDYFIKKADFFETFKNTHSAKSPPKTHHFSNASIRNINKPCNYNHAKFHAIKIFQLISIKFLRSLKSN